jgi:hypothetical protein
MPDYLKAFAAATLLAVAALAGIVQPGGHAAAAADVVVTISTTLTPAVRALYRLENTGPPSADWWRPFTDYVAAM